MSFLIKKQDSRQYYCMLIKLEMILEIISATRSATFIGWYFELAERTCSLLEKEREKEKACAVVGSEVDDNEEPPWQPSYFLLGIEDPFRVEP